MAGAVRVQSLAGRYQLTVAAKGTDENQDWSLTVITDAGKAPYSKVGQINGGYYRRLSSSNCF